MQGPLAHPSANGLKTGHWYEGSIFNTGSVDVIDVIYVIDVIDVIDGIDVIDVIDVML